MPHVKVLNANPPIFELLITLPSIIFYSLASCQLPVASCYYPLYTTNCLQPLKFLSTTFTSHHHFPPPPQSPATIPSVPPTPSFIHVHSPTRKEYRSTHRKEGTKKNQRQSKEKEWKAGFTMVQNRKKHRQNGHASEGVSEVSERASE